MDWDRIGMWAGLYFNGVKFNAFYKKGKAHDTPSPLKIFYARLNIHWVWNSPPARQSWVPSALRLNPPLTLEESPDAVFSWPPLTAE